MPNKDVIRLFWQESSPRIIRQCTNNTSTFCASECEEHRVSTLIQSVSGSKYSEPSWINAHNNTYHHTRKHSSQCLKRFKTISWTKWKGKQAAETKCGQPMLQKNLFTTRILKDTTLQKFCWYGFTLQRERFLSTLVKFHCLVQFWNASVLDICEANHIWTIVSEGEPSWADDTRQEKSLSHDMVQRLSQQKAQRVNRYCVSPLILWDNKQKKKRWSSVNVRIYPIFCYHTYNQVPLYDFLYSLSPLWSFSMT